MQKAAPGFQQFNRSAQKTADLMSKTAASLTQPSAARTANAWSEFMICTSRQARQNLSLPGQLLNCRTSGEIRDVHTRYLEDALNNHLRAGFALTSLMFPAIALMDVEHTDDALNLGMASISDIEQGSITNHAGRESSNVEQLSVSASPQSNAEPNMTSDEQVAA